MDGNNHHKAIKYGFSATHDFHNLCIIKTFLSLKKYREMEEVKHSVKVSPRWRPDSEIAVQTGLDMSVRSQDGVESMSEGLLARAPQGRQSRYDRESPGEIGAHLA